MTITISASGIALDGPLVAGEKVAVTVSGLALAAEDNPTLALLARFPDALLASVELAESADAPGTWTGELDTATKQTALFFATARADERRDAALELVSGRASLARLTVPMANSALCPKPDGSPFASPVYVPVPGPPGQGGDPYDQAPQMDGEASAGVSDEYARGDHRHPTDTTRQAVIEDLAAIRSGAAAGATAVQPSALSAYRTAAAQDAIDGAQDTAIAAKYTKPATGIPASDLASGVIPTALPNPQPLHIGVTNYDGSTEEYVPGATTSGDYGIVTLESATNSTNEGGYAATPLAVKKVADSVAAKANSTSIAPAFSASSTYAVGDYVTHEGLLYKCTTAVSTAGAWDAANWSAVAVADEMGGDTPLPFDAEVEYIENFNTDLPQYAAGELDVEADIYFADGYTGNGFAIGKWMGSKCFCIYMESSRLVARYNSTQTTTINKETGVWRSVGIHGSVFFYGATTAAITRAIFGDESIALNLSLGQDVRIRSLKVNIIGGAPVLDLVPVRAGQTGYLYDKISGAMFGSNKTETPTIGPDKATPTITTPGRIVELTPAIRYAFASPTPSVSGTTATVACEDRAINDFTVATGVTSLTITPPAAVTGRARDFFCRVTLTDSSLPTVTLSGGTIDIGATEVAGMTQGVNLLMFTEIASGHWLASRRSAS
jgi:hypothetical protein